MDYIRSWFSDKLLSFLFSSPVCRMYKRLSLTFFLIHSISLVVSSSPPLKALSFLALYIVYNIAAAVALSTFFLILGSLLLISHCTFC